MHKICWIIVLSFLSVVSAAARYTDCEVAPPVQYATQNVEDDDYTVTVIYTCERGYELRGESKLVCDLDTDEWLGDPPFCERVEQVTSEHVTDTNGNKDGTTSHEETGSASSTTTGKKKGIQEADRITSEFAKQLDMSCYNPPKVAAPQIKNGQIVTYDRRQKKGHIFLVAIYNCSVKYEMEDVTNSILYCSKKSWIGERPVCIPITDEYGDDYEEGEDEEGDEDEEEEIEEEERRRHQESRTEVNRIDNNRYDESGSSVREENENNEIDREEVLNRKPIEEITEATPRVFNETCGSDRGGCDHECRMVMYPEESEPRIICSCYSGFTLDIYDMRRCNDIDECLQNNGGCEQICTNVPGSFQCSCNSGLQIDTVTGNTCIDINECLLRNGHGPCQDTCHNLWSTYMCTCENLPGTRISKYNNHTCEDNGECAKNNGDCSHKCLTIVGRIFCLCPDGFYLTDDWKTCKDIDECTKSDISSLCPYGCENTHGSYRCLEPPPTRIDDEEIEEEIDEENHRKQQSNENDRREENEIENNNIVVEPKNEQNCRDGYQMNNQNECIDIDECAEGRTGCEYCQNVNGGFECYCPDGYELSDNEKTCQDINECEVYSDYGDENDENNEEQVRSTGGNTVCSHECVNMIGSYQCKCPNDFHLHTDKRTCVKDYCQDLINPELNKIKCSHNCIDETEGFKCDCPQGYTLDSDLKTCITSTSTIIDTDDDDECIKYDGQSSCHPGTCVSGGEYGFSCICPSGYLQKERRCHDIDECSTGVHKCSHDCINNQGSYECNCPPGLRLSSDSHDCQDINECIDEPNVCGNDLTCENTYGSYKCVCPEGKEFQSDGKCAVHFDACAIENGKCSHKCTSHNSYAICDCPEGMVLREDDHTCIENNPCHQDNGGCTQNCNPNAQNAENRCYCNQGYELMPDQRTCMDYDECKENNAGCSQICINQPGSYSCTCEVGFDLEADLHTCYDVNECTQHLHDCSHLCVNIPGSYECACPAGYEIAKESKFICEDINECEITTNGGCSHRCINTLGAYYCDCPTGHSLSEDNRTCAILNECNVGERKCSHNCENRIGGYQCFCPVGMKLAEDDSTCIDVNECNEENGGCSHTCHNNEGSYSCSCPEGYNLGDDSRNCFDIDECLENNGGCNQYCVNFGGGFKCECAPNYGLANDGRTCQSENYCNHENGGCQQICESTSSGPRCSCRPGFILDSPNNTTCTDIDECRYSNTCQQECRNTIGSFECRCHSGYTKDALGQCIDVNECEFLNGGCSTNSECINLPGSFKCTCHDGYKLTVDKKTCFEIKDYCMPLKPPRNGEIHCTRSRHKTQLYYKTKCSVWCHKGFRLEGPSTRHCNGTGEWDEYENQCRPQSCPPLPKPEHGTILPASCLLGNIFAGERCLLHCPSGFIPSGKRAAICNVDQTWSTNSTLECVSMPLSVPTMSSSFPIASAIPASVATSHTSPVSIKPYIKCPQDTILILPSGQKTVFIRLEQPKTNVDYFKLVDSHPDWAKNLDAHLGAGVHIITFRARSPNSNLNAICKTVITVKEAHPPTVVYCPPSYDIQLGMNERARSLSWKEPVFQSHGHLKQIYKSKVPGEMFGPGVHNILYVATDRDGQSSRCEFKLIVRGNQHHQISSAQHNNHNNRIEGSRLAGYKVNGLENHESYLLCPGKESIKIETNYPVHVPVGCFIKNIRIHGMRHHHKRRHHSYKITIIGLDEIGYTCAATFMRDYRIPMNLCLIDNDKDKAKCIMSDLDHCSGYFPSISVSSSSDNILRHYSSWNDPSLEKKVHSFYRKWL